MGTSVPMSREGYERLKRDLERFESKRPAVLTALGEARDKGDLTENAEYLAARETLAGLESKIAEVRGKLARAEIVDKSRAPSDKVAFGARVKVLDLDAGDEEVFTLVGAGEEDFLENRILTTSPLGQALIGRKAGEEVEFQAPRGKFRYRVVSIEY